MSDRIVANILIGTIFLLIGCSGSERPKKDAATMIDSLKRELTAAEIQIDSLQVVRDTPVTNKWYNASIEGRTLLKQGIENPEKYIEESLRTKPQLIPIKPVLGGKMRFVRIQVLGSHWVIAEYEDGHIVGRSIYKYQIKPNGEIQFAELLSDY